MTGRQGQGDGFCHEAYFYVDGDEFLGGTVPFVEAGLAAGETVLVALPQPRLESLQGALGPAADEVAFHPMEEIGRNPGRLISAWQCILQAVDSSRGVRGIGEPIWPGRNADEVDECERHERLVNFVFGEEPALKVMCPYNAAALDDEVLAAAERSHLYSSGSRDAAPPEPIALDGLLEGPLTPPGRPGVSLFFGRKDLRMVRHVVSQCARSAGLDTRRNEDLVLAVCEAATNSIQHAGGNGRLRIWEENDNLVCQVSDAGRIEDPLVGRQRPRPEQITGRGLWIANQICDLVQIRSGDEGTHVRMRMAIPGVAAPAVSLPDKRLGA